MKSIKKQIGLALAILAVLAMAYWWGGNATGLRGWKVSSPAPAPLSTGAEALDDLQQQEQPENSSPDKLPKNEDPEASSLQLEEEAGVKAPQDLKPGSDKERPLTPEEKLALAASLAGEESSAGVEKGSAGQDRYRTDPVPAGKPNPVEPRDAVLSDVVKTCTLAVRCDTILDNIDWLDKEKAELVPADGVIFPATAVTFYEGENVFNVLQRVMKQNKIHLEFKNTPIYNSAYIEGINNLYEFDCGELSGWICKINDWFPNYGCTRYQLKDGDVVEWVYTCDLGVDVGGYYAVNGE